MCIIAPYPDASTSVYPQIVPEPTRVTINPTIASKTKQNSIYNANPKLIPTANYLSSVYSVYHAQTADFIASSISEAIFSLATRKETGSHSSTTYVMSPKETVSDNLFSIIHATLTRTMTFENPKTPHTSLISMFSAELASKTSFIQGVNDLSTHVPIIGGAVGVGLFLLIFIIVISCVGIFLIRRQKTLAEALNSTELENTIYEGR